MITAKVFRELLTESDWPGLTQWLVEKLVGKSGAPDDIGQRMFTLSLVHYYHVFRGEAGAMSVLLDIARETVRLGQAAPVYLPVPFFIEAAYAWLIADYPRCLSAARQGLKRAEESGIHRWSENMLTYGMFAALALRDSKASKELLTKFADLALTERPTMRIMYDICQAYDAATDGQWRRALMRLDAVIRETTKISIPKLQFLALHLQAGIAWEDGQRDLAWHSLRSAEGIEQATQNGFFSYLRLMIEASFALDDQREEVSLAYLEHALQRGRTLGVYNAWWPLPDKMGRLCVLALENEIEQEYVKTFIARHHLPPPDNGAHLEAWPWPIKIYTLGRFEILRHERTVTLGRKKTPKVPLTLLQAVIALGGTRPAGASVEEIAALLWPDSDGDSAMRSFETTLSRLRNEILVEEGAIVNAGGSVRLNLSLCWVDVHAFQAACRGPSIPGVMALSQLRRLHHLYRGCFLPHGALWVDPLRAKLKNRFVSSALHLAQEAIADGVQEQVRFLWEEMRQIEPDLPQFDALIRLQP